MNSQLFEYVAGLEGSIYQQIIAQWACSEMDMTSVSRDVSHLK